jgi:hypothetical protein
MCKSKLILFTLIFLVGGHINAFAQTGATAFGKATTEPAIDSKNGSTIFLLTPDNAPFPSKANPMAVAPMYLPMYPLGSTVVPASLNCQPHNCNHLQVLPFAAPGYPNGGASCTQWGFPANECSLVIGHDHLTGVPHTGDSTVEHHIILVVFTPEGIAHGAANLRTLTLVDLATLVTRGYAFEAPTPVILHGSIVSSTVYYKGTPQSF